MSTRVLVCPYCHIPLFPDFNLPLPETFSDALDTPANFFACDSYATLQQSAARNTKKLLTDFSTELASIPTTSSGTTENPATLPTSPLKNPKAQYRLLESYRPARPARLPVGPSFTPKNLHLDDYVCPFCNKPPVIIVSTREGLLGTLIHNYKYSSTRALARPLAELFAATIPDIDENTHLVPLPTSTRHIRARGLDHMKKIAKNLAALTGAKLDPCLIRMKNTVQVGSDAKTRKKQAREAYALKPNFTPEKDVNYLLLDDVWTTGSSMTSALDLMQSAGVDTNHLAAAVLAISSID